MVVGVRTRERRLRRDGSDGLVTGVHLGQVVAHGPAGRAQADRHVLVGLVAAGEREQVAAERAADRLGVGADPRRLEVPEVLRVQDRPAGRAHQAGQAPEGGGRGTREGLVVGRIAAEPQDAGPQVGEQPGEIAGVLELGSPGAQRARLDRQPDEVLADLADRRAGEVHAHRHPARGVRARGDRYRRRGPRGAGTGYRHRGRQARRRRHKRKPQPPHRAHPPAAGGDFSLGPGPR